MNPADTAYSFARVALFYAFLVHNRELRLLLVDLASTHEAIARCAGARPARGAIVRIAVV